MMLLTKKLLAPKPLLLIALLYSCIITALFFVSGQDLPKTKIAGADKIVHIAVYFILVNFWLLYLYVKNNYILPLKWIVTLLISITAYGIIIEILQERFTSSRSADILDVVANLFGALIGVLFFKGLKTKLKP